jgi:hypothetical protein
LREALIHIGARYGEILVEQLNEAPHRWREAFSAWLGLQPAPALAAHVLLSFQPVASRAPAGASIVVPAHTEVAAPPLPGDNDPLVYETLSDLALLRAQPMSAVAIDPQRLASAEVTGLLSASGCSTRSHAAAGRARVAHRPAGDARGQPAVAPVRRARRDGRRHAAAAGDDRLGVGHAARLRPLALQSDTTMQLRRSGVVMLEPPAQWAGPCAGRNRGALAELPAVAGRRPLPDGETFAPPRASRLQVSASTRTDPSAPEAACFGAVGLDQSKAYLPFGERPRFGDVFHLAAPAFAQPGARVTLSVRLTNPAGAADSPIPPVRREGKPRVGLGDPHPARLDAAGRLRRHTVVHAGRQHRLRRAAGRDADDDCRTGRRLGCARNWCPGTTGRRRRSTA